MPEVHDTPTGATSMSPRALARAITKRLESVTSVKAVSAVQMTGHEAVIRIRPARGTSPHQVRDDALEALDIGFWIDLGLADIAPRLIIDP